MAEIETRKDADDGTSKYWQRELKAAEKERKDWIGRAHKVVKKYRDERDETNTDSQFNILFSNTETLKGALYANTAAPDIRRRWQDADPVGKAAAIVLEKGVSYQIDENGVDEQIEAAVEDYLLPGAGSVRVKYEPVIETVPDLEERPVEGEDGTPMFDEMGQPVTQMVPVEREHVADQLVSLEYIFWEDLMWSPARKWQDVRWISIKHTFSRDEGVKRFGEKFRNVPLNWNPASSAEGNRNGQEAEIYKKAEVYEIWCKTDKKVYWIAKDYEKILEEGEPPLALKNFYPIPKPLLSITTNDQLIPVPEYTIYQDQAAELDKITGRIDKLTGALKVRGIYNKALEEIERLSKASDNELVPVDNFEAFEGGGLDKHIQYQDITSIASVLVHLYNQRSQLVQTIYEITGISDVIRGATDPNETATAQRLKGQFGSMRLQKRQTAVQVFVRDAYRLKAEVIAEHFEPHVLQAITGEQYAPQEWAAIVQVLRDDQLRSYKVDIETDSTVFKDASEEQKSRIELFKAVTEFIQQWLPIVNQSPAMLPLAKETILFTLRGFKAGRMVEDAVEDTFQQLEQAAQQPKQPNPEAVKVMAEAEAIKGEEQRKNAETQVGVEKTVAETEQIRAETVQTGVETQVSRVVPLHGGSVL